MRTANVTAAATDHGAIAAHELGGAVAPGVLARDDRQAGEVPPHVLRELIHRRIPPPRLFAQRLEDDVVEVAGKLAAQTIDVDGHPSVGFRRRRGPRLRAASVFRRRRPAVIDGGDRSARADGLRFADDAYDVGRCAAGEPVRQAAGEQLVEQHAERVDVGGRGTASPRTCSGLAYSGVISCRPAPSARASGRRARVEQLGDAEVEQLGRAVGGHQDVGRLEVAVDDQVLVRVLDGRADVTEQLEARRGVEPVRVAVVDRSAVPRRTPSRSTAGRPACCRRRAAWRCSDARGWRGSAARGGSGGRCCRCPYRA